MTGRHHWRRGDYHYKPMYLEQGRKIIPQMFKRAGYRTFLIGKAQPTDSVSQTIQTVDHYTECRTESGSQWSAAGGGERRRRSITADANKEWYNGGTYVPQKHDFMYMNIGENGQEMSPETQKVCWLGADATVFKICQDADQCHSLKIGPNVAKYNACVEKCLQEDTMVERLENYKKIVEDFCPSRKSRKAFCKEENTDYKNVFLEQGSGVCMWNRSMNLVLYYSALAISFHTLSLTVTFLLTFLEATKGLV